MHNVIKMFGAERSGTNYLQWVIKNNFDDVILISYYKHIVSPRYVRDIDWNKKGVCEESLHKHFEHFWRKIITYGGPPKVHISPNIANEIRSPSEENKTAVRLGRAIRSAWLNHEVKFIINVKNPYSQCVSQQRSRKDME